MLYESETQGFHQKAGLPGHSSWSCSSLSSAIFTFFNRDKTPTTGWHFDILSQQNMGRFNQIFFLQASCTTLSFTWIDLPPKFVVNVVPDNKWQSLILIAIIVIFIQVWSEYLIFKIKFWFRIRVNFNMFILKIFVYTYWWWCNYYYLHEA